MGDIFSEHPTVGGRSGKGHFLVRQFVIVYMCNCPKPNFVTGKRPIVSGSGFPTPLAFWVVFRMRKPSIWDGKVATLPGTMRVSLKRLVLIPFWSLSCLGLRLSLPRSLIRQISNQLMLLTLFYLNYLQCETTNRYILHRLQKKRN